MRFSLVLALIVALIVTLIGVSCATQPKAPIPVVDAVLPKLEAVKTVEERVKIEIDERLRLGVGVGYAAAIREEGKTKTLAFGKKTLEPAVEFRDRDLIALGTLSKVFTGILIEAAIIEEKLRLDQRLDEVFSELKGASTGAITISELGLHESGLPKHPVDVQWSHIDSKEALETLRTYSLPPLVAGAPNRNRENSNWGYLTLGLVLEKVYQRPYAEILALKILRPLDMQNTGATVLSKKNRKKKIRRVVPAFALNTDPLPNLEFVGAAAAVGGVESSAVDMAQFLEALETPPPGKLGRAITDSLNAGLGWDSLPGANLVWKSGETSSQTSMLVFNREKKCAVYIGANSLASPKKLGFSAVNGGRDDLGVLAIPKRTLSDEEAVSLRGHYRNKRPATETPGAPLTHLEIIEAFGRIGIRYHLEAKPGALLVPSEEAGAFTIVDGNENLDTLRLVSDGVSFTLRTPQKGFTFEATKIEAPLEKYPAQE